MAPPLVGLGGAAGLWMGRSAPSVSACVGTGSMLPCLPVPARALPDPSVATPQARPLGSWPGRGRDGGHEAEEGGPELICH